MENEIKFVKRSFYVHQYEKEELFLSNMASQGWHFVKLHKGFPTKYEFKRGEPMDYIYRLDYVTEEQDTEDYHQLFLDAGWEEVLPWDGVFNGKWYYFRKLRAEGRDNSIYTDEESKFQMFDRLWKTYGLFFAIFLFLEYNGMRTFIERLIEFDIASVWNVLYLLIMGLCTLVFLFYMYLTIGIVMMRIKLKHRLTQNF